MGRRACRGRGGRLRDCVGGLWTSLVSIFDRGRAVMNLIGHESHWARSGGDHGSHASGATVMGWRRLARCAAVLAAGGLVLSACSSGGKPAAGGTTTTLAGTGTTTTTPPATVATITKSKADGLFDTAATPANAALGSLATQAAGWTPSTTAAQAAAVAQPALESVIALEPKLQTLALYYPSAGDDLRTEINAAAAIQHDIAALSTMTAENAASVEQTLTTDIATLNAADKKVRSDLGLPAT
jgi:hypothetical protein